MNNQQWKLCNCIQHLWLFLLLIDGIQAISQNLIPDSSFEQNNKIPIMYSEIAASKYWNRPSLGTSDLYCKCSRKQSKFSLVNVPTNPMGFQKANSGNCYAGIFAHSHGSYREYLQTELKETLEANAIYLITMHISLADYSRASVDKFGVAFSKRRIKHTSTGVITNVKVNYFKLDSISLSDTSKWQKISLEYKADGGENFMTIGSFDVIKLQKTMVIAPKESHTRINQSTHRDAYYFLDDISLHKVREAPLIEEDWIETPITKPVELSKINYTLTSILFESNKYRLKEIYKKPLDSIAMYLKTNTKVCLQIEGHTDKTGNKKSNQLLSEKRAYEVYSYLLKCNLDAKRLFWKGRSDSAAFGNIKTENKQLERRVDLKFVDCSVK